MGSVWVALAPVGWQEDGLNWTVPLLECIPWVLVRLAAGTSKRRPFPVLNSAPAIIPLWSFLRFGAKSLVVTQRLGRLLWLRHPNVRCRGVFGIPKLPPVHSIVWWDVCGGRMRMFSSGIPFNCEDFLHILVPFFRQKQVPGWMVEHVPAKKKLQTHHKVIWAFCPPSADTFVRPVFRTVVFSRHHHNLKNANMHMDLEKLNG